MLAAVPPAPLFPIDNSHSTPSSLNHGGSEPTSTIYLRPPMEQPQQCLTLQPSKSIEIEMAGTIRPLETHPRGLQFKDLPAEIHEAVLDHLFGVRGSALASITPSASTASSWSKSLRHPRRKALSDLALVSQVWRPLVQDRIYRHIQIKGTTDGLLECADWFASHPYLGTYVRHIEIWVPVWGDRLKKTHSSQCSHRDNGNGSRDPTDTTGLIQAMASSFDPSITGRTNCNFTFANRNATLQQIFYHVACYFPDAKMLTLEGGHCKKPPMIRHFDTDPSGEHGKQHLEALPNIQTFIMKGAWNIMRDYRHWSNLSVALPNLREWHCFYSKPKLEAHITMSKILANFPDSLTRLNISLEGFCNKTGGTHSRWLNTSHHGHHLCRLLGAVIPQLESLTFTGKICSTLFNAAKPAMAESRRTPRLKSLDFVVKACCWEQRMEDGSLTANELSGITNMSFINAFERLIVSAVLSLDSLSALEYMRIRFIDLDSICGLLNPYFQLVGNSCTGLWSETILEGLHQTRPLANFEELSAGILPQYRINSQTGTRTYPNARPLSIKSNAYRIIADKSEP